MDKITSGELKMKPKWYFALGTFLGIIGIILAIISSIYFTSIIFFISRPHGPNGANRLQQLVESLPLWVPIVAILSISAGVYFLKKFDFSYQKNLKLVILISIFSIISAAYAIDMYGLNDQWFKFGPNQEQGRRYRKYQNGEKNNLQIYREEIR